jgi:hypothetical protein
MAFEMLDTVRLVDLIDRGRVIDDTVGTGDEPQLGDTGTVVEIVGEGRYLVECDEGPGGARWVAEFLEDELELAS